MEKQQQAEPVTLIEACCGSQSSQTNKTLSEVPEPAALLIHLSFLPGTGDQGNNTFNKRSLLL